MRSSARSTSALASLEENGYVIGANEPHGKRPRKTYRLTDKGRAALSDWLHGERVPDFEQRDEGLLRLFFADALPLEKGLELVQRVSTALAEADVFSEGRGERADRPFDLDRVEAAGVRPRA